ncbi:hypothetical protein EDB82DRAFT_502044 [Fusarium venenatum]|uniref:uncharacterized protein n=1 Tax=Fusarium venenatum TaxID=56646 RepID=UPI001D1E65BA|nr:hypothetical protein EDB82DRAFT_502044 [Fusarium venenatum]
MVLPSRPVVLVNCFLSRYSRRYFCNGSCWVLANSLLPRIDSAKYSSWLDLMREGNSIITRVVYEDVVFYDTCNESGILMWQDFRRIQCYICDTYQLVFGLGSTSSTSSRTNVILNMTNRKYG